MKVVAAETDKVVDERPGVLLAHLGSAAAKLLANVYLDEGTTDKNGAEKETEVNAKGDHRGLPAGAWQTPSEGACVRFPNNGNTHTGHSNPHPNRSHRIRYTPDESR